MTKTKEHDKKRINKRLKQDDLGTFWDLLLVCFLRLLREQDDIDIITIRWTMAGSSMSLFWQLTAH